MSAQRQHGTVIRFDRTYGWIRADTDQMERFVHFSEIVAEADTYRTLYVGDRVSFEIGRRDGRVCAMKVWRLPAATS